MRWRISDAHAMTIVTEDEIRTSVLNVASGTLRIVSPRGQLEAPVRIRMYDANSAPNSMTSEARNSQMPILPLVRPVSRRTSTVYGMSIADQASYCGEKSLAAPGTLYS